MNCVSHLASIKLLREDFPPPRMSTTGVHTPCFTRVELGSAAGASPLLVNASTLLEEYDLSSRR